MPRKAREKSTIGVYAVVIKGSVNNYKLFGDDFDYNEFIARIDNYLDTAVIAFSLCENFICMIVKESENGIGSDIKPLTTSYAVYYRKRYGVKGGLFESRFKSSPIETAEDLAAQLACIHKFSDLTGKECYIGRYVNDEFFLSDDALKLLGGRNIYDNAMSKTNALTPFFSRAINGDPGAKRKTKPSGKAADSGKEKASKNKANKNKSVENTTSESKPIENTAPENNPIENTTSENDKAGESTNSKKRSKKDSMPLWLL